MKKKIAIGSDHAGFQLKEKIKKFLNELSYQVVDVGCHSEESCDYPDFGNAVAQLVKNGEVQTGIVICGTGIGVSISANKIPRIRAALCLTKEMAELARRHNDANILALGARIQSEDTIEEIIKTFLTTDFDGGRHIKRIEKIKLIEDNNLC